MRVLITGGLGFIGSNLVRRATAAGFNDISVFDNGLYGKDEHIEQGSATIIKADLSNTAALADAVSEHDVIVHLAADTTVIGSIERPEYNFETNVISTFNLLEAMRKNNKKKLLFASTGGAITGEIDPPLNEDMPARPLSPYGASKLAAEGYLGAYNASFGMTNCAFRFSNVYGPGSFHKGSVVAAYFKAILNNDPLIVYGDGEQTRDFVFVDDICDTLIRALDSTQGGVFQLGSGTPTSVNSLIEKISRITGKVSDSDIKYLDKRVGEVEKTYCDVSKAKNEIDYNPKVDLEGGLTRTWEWFLTQQSLFTKAA